MLSVRIGPREPTKSEDDEAARAEQARKRAEQEQARAEAERIRKQQEAERQRKEDARKAEAERKRLADQAKRDELERQRRALRDKKERERKRAAGTGSGGMTPAQAAQLKRQQQRAQGFQDLRDSQTTNRQLGESVAAGMGSIMSVDGGNRPTDASTWHRRLTMGAGGLFFPVIADNSGADISDFSSVDFAGGISIRTAVEIWPRYKPRWGAGGIVRGSLSGMAMPGGAIYAVEGGVGLKAYVGREAGWSAGGELGGYARAGGVTMNLFGTKVNGSGAYVLLRPALYGRYCYSAHTVFVNGQRKAGGFCESDLRFGVGVDVTSIANTTAGTARVGSVLFASIAIAGRFRWSAELGISYPAPGSPRYALDEDDRDGAGLFGMLAFERDWSWYGGGRR